MTKHKLSCMHNTTAAAALQSLANVLDRPGLQYSFVSRFVMLVIARHVLPLYVEHHSCEQ